MCFFNSEVAKPGKWLGLFVCRCGLSPCDKRKLPRSYDPADLENHQGDLQMVCFGEISLSENEVSADGPRWLRAGKREEFFAKVGDSSCCSLGTPETGRGLSNSQPQTCVSDQGMGILLSWAGWRPILEGGSNGVHRRRSRPALALRISSPGTVALHGLLGSNTDPLGQVGQKGRAAVARPARGRLHA